MLYEEYPILHLCEMGYEVVKFPGHTYNMMLDFLLVTCKTSSSKTYSQIPLKGPNSCLAWRA